MDDAQHLRLIKREEPESPQPATSASRAEAPNRTTKQGRAGQGLLAFMQAYADAIDRDIKTIMDL